MTTPNIVATLPRNSSQVIRVCVAQFKGLPRLDIRVWYQAGKEYRPGAQGVSIPLAQLQLLRAALANVPEGSP